MISWTETNTSNPKKKHTGVKRLRRGCRSQNIPSLKDNVSGEIFITDDDKTNHLNEFLSLFQLHISKIRIYLRWFSRTNL